VLSIRTQDLVKNYGRVRALRGVSFSIGRGEIYGLLGQNGAGKTTLVKILLGITRATSGEAMLLDRPAGEAAVRRRVGYLPEDHRFPDYHSGASLLDFYGTLLGMPRRQRRRRMPELLGLVGLKSRMHSKIRTYSKGMKQRLGIAQAILHDPEVIFLDEPTDGVDPGGRREIRRIMQQLQEQGKTIFLNSHLLSEVELICHRIGILQSGELVREGDVASLTQQRGHFLIGLAEGEALPEEELRSRGYRVARRAPFWEVELPDGQTVDPVVDVIREARLHLRHLEEKKLTLEDIFLQTVVEAEPGVDVPVVEHASDEQTRLPR
jgi:ABC-2 type transport system ATP-binding protein